MNLIPSTKHLDGLLVKDDRNWMSAYPSPDFGVVHPCQVLPNDQRLNNIAIEIVQLWSKFALLSKDARLGAFDRVVLGLWSWASMAVDALEVCARAAVHAGRHARNKVKSRDLCRARLVVVSMGAVVAIRTLLAEEVYITELHGFYAIHLRFVIIPSHRIYTLAQTIASNDFVAV